MTALDLAGLVDRYNRDRCADETGHMCTVGQLRDYLDQFPGDAFVVLAKDGEGNEHSPLALDFDECLPRPAADLGWYLPDTTWSGEVRPIGPDADGDVHEPVPGDLVAVVLGPVN